ncbi:MAG: endo-1,4-beta-xylanase [Beijerinckiaceae bacterium]
MQAQGSKTAAPRYGSAAMKEDFLGDPLYQDALVRHCDIIVPMNDLKWEAVHPEKDRFNFEDADRILNFAKKHNKDVRGHTLCWYNAMPAWTKSITTRRQAETELRRHIETVVGRYKGRIPSWDVVNEALAHDPAKQGTWRDTSWHRLLGPDHIDIAFKTASEADPKAQLVYNDYDLENIGERHDLRRKNALALVRRLKDKNIPIHALGFQGHLYAEQPIDSDAVGRFVSDLKSMDVAVLVTELDVIDWRLPAPVAERDRLIARHVETFLKAVASAGTLQSIISWGITDKFSWIHETFKRDDSLQSRPLPLDRDYKPKPMMEVLSSLRARR